MDYLTLFVIATATAFATGLGAVPVYFLGTRTESLRPVLWGCTVGVMTLASLLGLLKPAFDEGDALIQLRCRDGPFLPGGAASNHKKIVTHGEVPVLFGKDLCHSVGGQSLLQGEVHVAAFFIEICSG